MSLLLTYANVGRRDCCAAKAGPTQQTHYAAAGGRRHKGGRWRVRFGGHLRRHWPGTFTSCPHVAGRCAPDAPQSPA